MATKKQKEELLATLKFTPQTYRISVGGYGGECYIGKVDRKIYDYFKQHKIDMEEYASWGDEEKWDFIPVDMMPFPPGSPYECDGFCHASGPEMTDMNSVTIEDEKGNVVWEGNLSLDWLDDEQIPVGEWETAIMDDEPEGTVFFWGGQGEKGLLYGGEFEVTRPFDPKLLKFNFSNADGWYLCNSISYDGEDISNDDLSTTGKWGENKWVIVGEEEVYEGVERDDFDEEYIPTAPIHVTNTDNPIDFPPMPEPPMTDWYTVDINPVRKGTYEVRTTTTPVWPFPATFKAEWTGRTWKDSDGEKVKGIINWRGLSIDPSVL